MAVATHKKYSDLLFMVFYVKEVFIWEFFYLNYKISLEIYFM